MSSIINEINRILRLDDQFSRRPRLTKNGQRSKANVRLRRAIQRRRSWDCHLCGVQFHDISEVTVDHVVPRSLKTYGEKEIVDLACGKCNNVRGNVPILMYRMFQVMQNAYPNIVYDVIPSREERRERYQRGKKLRRALRRASAT